ncbi:MAG: hypothetical protein ACRYFS_18220 [Janthinobacterium lividum]
MFDKLGPFGVVPFMLGVMTMLWSPPLAIALFTRAAARSGSYLRWDKPKKKVYSPPPAFAAGAATFIIYVVMLAFSLPGKGSLSELLVSWWCSAARQTQIVALSSGSLLVVSLYCGTLQWLRRKCALILDIGERRYQTFDVSSVVIKPQTGTWADISGVYVRRANSERGSEPYAYFVCLKWRGNSKAYSALGGFGQQDRASDYAEKVAQELRLPLISETMP